MQAAAPCSEVSLSCHVCIFGSQSKVACIAVYTCFRLPCDLVQSETGPQRLVMAEPGSQVVDPHGEVDHDETLSQPSLAQSEEDEDQVLNGTQVSQPSEAEAGASTSGKDAGQGEATEGIEASVAECAEPDKPSLLSLSLSPVRQDGEQSQQTDADDLGVLTQLSPQHGKEASGCGADVSSDLGEQTQQSADSDDGGMGWIPCDALVQDGSVQMTQQDKEAALELKQAFQGAQSTQVAAGSKKRRRLAREYSNASQASVASAATGASADCNSRAVVAVTAPLPDICNPWQSAALPLPAWKPPLSERPEADRAPPLGGGSLGRYIGAGTTTALQESAKRLVDELPAERLARALLFATKGDGVPSVMKLGCSFAGVDEATYAVHTLLEALQQKGGLDSSQMRELEQSYALENDPPLIEMLKKGDVRTDEFGNELFNMIPKALVEDCLLHLN